MTTATREAPDTAPTKRALLIGINAYPRITPLSGCVNDVMLMKEILAGRFGFAEEHMNVLLDGAATRNDILRAFDRLVAETEPDDIVVFYFAGHGSQMTDFEGDESSGYDSTIMPYDTEGWSGINRDITDDEIHVRLGSLGERTQFITLIFDCCHSGSITRDADGPRARAMPRDERDEIPLGPDDMPRVTRGASDEPPAFGPSKWLPLDKKYVLIAGCADEEVSYEYTATASGSPVQHGALTYFLSEELRAVSPGMTYRDVFERAAARVNANQRLQHPQMEGRPDREVFGVRDLPPVSKIRVTGRIGERVTLDVGAAHGMSVGTTFDIYAEGAKADDGGESLGEVEIGTVGAVTSDARITHEVKKGAIVRQCRAALRARAWHAPKLTVSVTGPATYDADMVALRDALSAYPMLDITDQPETAAARVVFIAPRATAGSGEPAAELGALDVATIAVRGGDQEMLMPPKSIGDLGDVTDNLVKIARYRHALALDNSDSRLRGKVTTELLQKNASGQWTPAVPNDGGYVVIDEYEPVVLRVKNSDARPLYVSLIDFGMGMGIERVYPPDSAVCLAAANESFLIGSDDEPLQFAIPDVFPFFREFGSKKPVEGMEHLKLFVTTSPADFSVIAQESVRSVDGHASDSAGSALSQLWSSAMFGHASGSGTRELVRPQMKQDDWTAVVKSFVVRRQDH